MLTAALFALALLGRASAHANAQALCAAGWVDASAWQALDECVLYNCAAGADCAPMPSPVQTSECCATCVSVPWCRAWAAGGHSWLLGDVELPSRRQGDDDEQPGPLARLLLGSQLAALSRGRIVEVRPLRRSVVMRVTLQHGARPPLPAVLKLKRGPCFAGASTPCAGVEELVAFQLDRALGLHRALPVAGRVLDERDVRALEPLFGAAGMQPEMARLRRVLQRRGVLEGTLTPFLEGVRTCFTSCEPGQPNHCHFPAQARAELLAFDFLLANNDRNLNCFGFAPAPGESARLPLHLDNGLADLLGERRSGRPPALRAVMDAASASGGESEEVLCELQHLLPVLSDGPALAARVREGVLRDPVVRDQRSAVRAFMEQRWEEAAANMARRAEELRGAVAGARCR